MQPNEMEALKNGARKRIVGDIEDDPAENLQRKRVVKRPVVEEEEEEEFVPKEKRVLRNRPVAKYMEESDEDSDEDSEELFGGDDESM